MHFEFQNMKFLRKVTSMFSDLKELFPIFNNIILAMRNNRGEWTKVFSSQCGKNEDGGNLKSEIYSLLKYSEKYNLQKSPGHMEILFIILWLGTKR